MLAMTASEEGSRESLRFRLEGGGESVGVWGHEYVRCEGGSVANLSEAGECLPAVCRHTL